MTQPLLQFDGVSKVFRRTAVLRDIDLTMNAGDRIALVGSNGAGKTTLIRCLLGEYDCRGVVSVRGLDPRINRRLVLSDIGFVPQLPPPLRMPVGQLIHYAAGVCMVDPAGMYSVIEALKLDPDLVVKQPFVKLSGGQKQKILIGVGLGRGCRVLVMDEPAANLDPEARHIFFQLLAERQDKAAMLISSHRLDEVAALVNRVVELDQGQVVLDDEVADTVDMAGELGCRVRMTRPEAAMEKALGQWGFTPGDEEGLWIGTIAGPDRLRFLGLLSRYTALLSEVRMEELGAPVEVREGE